MSSGRNEIEHCTRRGLPARAARSARERPGRFVPSLAPVTRVPGEQGRYEVRLRGEMPASRRIGGVYRKPLVLERPIRDRIVPGQPVGHERQCR